MPGLFCLNQPLLAIDDLVTSDNTLPSVEKVAEMFQGCLTRSDIPLLSSSGLENGQLVAFSGMVQDMMEPLMYLDKVVWRHLEAAEKKTTFGRYRYVEANEDGWEVDSESSSLKELLSFHVIEPPGLSIWARKSRDSSDSVVKRGRQEEYSPARCVVRIYNTEASLQLNSLYNFVGVYSPPANSTLQNKSITAQKLENGVIDMEAVDQFETELEHYDNLPTIHVLAVQQISHALPPIVDDNKDLSIAETRKHLLGVLASLLGDDLAAEYLLCHLVSGVYSRTSVLPLGNMSLNLAGISPSHASLIGNMCEQLLDRIVRLPITTESLSGDVLTPHKDYARGVLVSTPLQLSPGTHLVIDETNLQAGQLNEVGVRNLSALRELAVGQQVRYNFYVEQSFDCDVPTLVLAERGGSLVTCDFVVHLPPGGGESFDAEKAAVCMGELLNSPSCATLRRYVAEVKGARHWKMSDELQQIVSQDYVQQRKNEGAKVTAEDLSRHLTLARYMSLSRGESQLELTTWRLACGFEAQRAGRLAAAVR